MGTWAVFTVKTVQACRKIWLLSNAPPMTHLTAIRQHLCQRLCLSFPDILGPGLVAITCTSILSLPHLFLQRDGKQQSDCNKMLDSYKWLHTGEGWSDIDITSTLCSRISQIAAGFSPVLAHWGLTGPREEWTWHRWEGDTNDGRQRCPALRWESRHRQLCNRNRYFPSEWNVWLQD